MMLRRRTGSDIFLPAMIGPSLITRSETACSGGSRFKWLQALPPVGAPIPYSSVLGALADSVRHSNQGGDALPRRLTELTGLRHWVFMNSGRAALSAVFMALHERRPDCNEVVIPAYTSYSVPAAVVRAGLKVRLCDVEDGTLGMAPSALERCVTPRTLCIVPHHLYGLPCRIAELCEIARAHGVPVVEDAAQGMGIQCGGRAGGAHGEVGIFSLSRGKNLPAAGGGVIGTNNAELAEVCRRTAEGRSHKIGRAVREPLEALLMATFIRPSLYWLPANFSFLKLGHSWFEPTFEIGRMSHFQRALFNRLLPLLNTLQRVRNEQASRLREVLARVPVRVLWPRDGDGGAFLRAPLLLHDQACKERVLSELRDRGLGATEGYPLALSRLPELRPNLASSEGDCPTAEWISERLITLPTHHWVIDSHRREILDVVKRCT
jgi:perosamine synthetase